MSTLAIVMLVSAVITLLLIYRLFAGRRVKAPKTPTSAPAGQKLSSAGKILGSAATGLRPLLPKVVAVAVVLGLVFFWPTFKPWFAEWLATSDGGEYFSLSQGAIEKSLWLVFVALTVGFVVYHFSSKFWGGVIETVVVVLCLFAIIFSFQGKTFDEWFTTDAKDLPPAERGCEVKETSIKLRIPKGGRPVKICPDAGGFYLLPEWGHRLSYKLSPSVQSEYGYLFDNPYRKLEDFFDFLPPGSHASKMPEPYLVIPKPGEHWRKSGLPGELLLYVTSVQ